MNPCLIDYLYIAATIAFTVYGQLILKWRVLLYGQMPTDTFGKLKFVFGMLLDPWIASGLASAFFASMAWIAAMTKFDLSQAYPFISLNFVFVFLMSAWLLSEPITLQRTLGLSLIILGTIVVARV